MTKKRIFKDRFKTDVVELEISQEDIKRGRPGNATTCAVSRVIRRELKARGIHNLKIEVTPYTIVYRLPGESPNWFNTDDEIEVLTPKKISQFISDFDDDKKKVKPITVKLRMPTEKK